MKYIYQSPKTRLRSTPVDEADARRRETLVAAGWTVVETIGAPLVVTQAAVDAVAPELAKAAPRLPEDIPYRDLLIDNGLDSLDLVRAALADIHKLHGFGPKRAATVRAHFEPPEA